MIYEREPDDVLAKTEPELMLDLLIEKGAKSVGELLNNFFAKRLSDDVDHKLLDGKTPAIISLQHFISDFKVFGARISLKQNIFQTRVYLVPKHLTHTFGIIFEIIVWG